jgi:hypothetical protein
MDEIQKEKSEGLSWEYLGEAMKERAELSGEPITPMAALMGQMFAVFAKNVIDEVGTEKGEAIIKKAVEDFGQTRGKRIAEKVKARGLPLSFKNFLIYMDLDTSAANKSVPNIDGKDLTLTIHQCFIRDGACDLALEPYFHYYCKWIDRAILFGYNPELTIEITKFLSGGDDVCFFRYIVSK